jgi:flagellar biosynthesis protein FliR
MYDPLAGGSSSILGRLWYLMAAVLFFLLDGHHWVIAGLARSYELCPVGELIYQPRLGLLAVEVVSALFSLGLRLAAPLIAALLLADLTMGLIGRGMPQMNLMLVGMPAKILLGLAALAACSPLIAGQLGQIIELYRGLLPQALGLLR